MQVPLGLEQLAQFAGHVLQEAADVAPTMSEYWPVPHDVHSVDPALAEYVPAVHFIHVAADVAASFVEYVPAGHGVQAVTAPDVEYVPAGHVLHMPSSAMYSPASHSTILQNFDVQTQTASVSTYF